LRALSGAGVDSGDMFSSSRHEKPFLQLSDGVVVVQEDRGRNAAALPVIDALGNAGPLIDAQQARELDVSADGRDEFYGFSWGHTPNIKRGVYSKSTECVTQG
jgi:hypothetical protein